MVRRKPVRCMPPSEVSAFRTAERYFKAKRRAPDMERTVLNVAQLSFSKEGNAQWTQSVPTLADKEGHIVLGASRSHRLYRHALPDFNRDAFASEGRSDLKETVWAYEMEGMDGILLIPNALSLRSQQKLAKRALSQYTLPPNVNNLDLHWHCATSSTNGLWQRALAQLEDSARAEHVAPKEGNARAPLPPLTLLQEHLRWVSLGYQYNWTTQLYDLSPATSPPVPPDLAQWCVYLTQQAAQVPHFRWPRTQEAIAAFEAEHGRVDLPTICSRTGKALPHPDRYTDAIGSQGEANTDRTDFLPQAGILNVYHEGATLTGHHDRSELHPYAPLVSVSLGRPGILLMGGYDRDEPPVPIVLHAGDALIMYNQGRKRLHGMPLVLPSEEHTKDDNIKEEKDMEDELVDTLLKALRLNINVRQVFI